MKQPSQRFFPTQTSRIRWFIPLLMGLLLIPGASIALQASVHSPHNGPDLVVTAITFDPPNPGAGTTGDIEVTVKNIGTEIAPAGFRTYIYVDPTDDPPNQSTGITTRVFRGQALDVNDTFTFARTDHEFTSDNPVVYAWVDPIWENNIVETDDNNNYLRVPSDPPPPNYEPNNDCNQATPINLNTEIQEHNLTPSGGLGSDHDWIQFNTVRGQKYTVHIDAPGADADLYAEYYTFCSGTPALGSGLIIEIKSDLNGPYYLKIGHNQPEYGPDTAYTVSVTTNTNVTPYTVTPTATSTATDMPPRPTDTHTPTVTPTNTGTNTRTNTPTNTPTGTETNTPTTISTSTPTHTNTPTLTRIPTRTPTRANTPTPTVTPSPVPSDATWTLLIYAMGDNDLERYLEDSRHGMIGRFKKLEDVVEEGVQVAIMFDGNDLGDTKYYMLDENGKWTEERPIAGTEARMDEPETLETFLKWGARRYPKSDYYALSLLGHASALLGMGPDESTDTTRGSFLEPNEIRDAIDDAQGNASFHINVIHFDGCSFGLFESTSIIHDTGNSNDMEPTYVIASPNTGWGVFAHEIYRGIAGDSSTPAAYAQSVAQYYAKKVAAEALPYTISVLDVAHYTAVKNATDALGNALTFYVNAQDTDARHSTLRQRRGASQIYDSGDYEIDERYDTYVDLRDLIDNFEIIADTRVETARVGVQEALDRFVLYTENKSGFMDGNRNYHDLDNAKGIAIFYPYGEMTGPIWERYVGADNSRDVSSQSQADPLFPNLTEGWGWTEFIKTLPPPPTGTPIEGSLREIEVNILSPKVDPFYDELVRTVEEQDFIVYLPIITR